MSIFVKCFKISTKFGLSVERFIVTCLMPAAHGHFGKGLIICRGIVAFVRLFQFKKEFKTLEYF